MKTVFVDSNYSCEIEMLGDKISINGDLTKLDVINISKYHFHFLLENKSYSAELVKINHKDKEATIKVNGKEYKVTLKDENDTLLEKMGIGIDKLPFVSDLKAPMPGLVLDVLVKP